MQPPAVAPSQPMPVGVLPTMTRIKRRNDLFGDEALLIAKRRRDMTYTGWYIDPRHGYFSTVWDYLLAIALVFVALVTPTEVAFLDGEGSYVTPLWVINRLVDALFIADLFVSFNMAIEAPMDEGGHWITNKRVIVRSYLRGYFAIDFVSCLPLWPVNMHWAAPLREPDGDGHLMMRTVVAVRLMKLMRLVKLTRLLKVSRVLRRELDDLLLHRLNFTYAIIRMISMLVLLLAYMHWQVS